MGHFPCPCPALFSVVACGFVACFATFPREEGAVEAVFCFFKGTSMPDKRSEAQRNKEKPAFATVTVEMSKLHANKEKENTKYATGQTACSGLLCRYLT